MAVPQRPGEITYYEELGVENTASADEIRDAFRILVRLLHPDQQSDPQLKEMAERQMRKLNRIYSVLSDGPRRAAYDQSLNSPRGAPIIVFSGSDGALKKLLVRGGAVAGLVFGAFLLIWFAANSNNSEVRGQEVRGGSAGKAGDSSESDAGEQISRLRDQLRATETERDSALEQLGRMARKPTDQASSAKGRPTKSTETTELAAATAMTELPSATTKLPAPSAATVTLPVANESAVAAAQFAGLWVYSRTAGSASPGGKSQYPPEFIEVTVTERNGALHGQYHSRYQVLDHAISPDVDFVFNGTPTGSALTCAWQGPGGARGRMTLKLLPTSAVEIAWNATELGSRQWLINGNATLVKK
jgi:curved DNA-binding protein CbpA